MFKYDPKAAAAPVLPDGLYDAEVATAEETKSKASGEDMLKITFKVYRGASSSLVTDYITNKSLWKLKKLCEAADIKGFDSGQIEPSVLIGHPVKVKLKVKKDETGKYADSNAVVGYAKALASTGEDLSVPEENIPF